jgi:ATP-dependent DNA helicase RecG
MARRLAQLSRIGVSELKAVGPRRAGGLRAMGIETVLDLVTHYPRRYVDRTNQATIGSLAEGEEAVVTASVVRSSSRRMRNGRTAAEIVVRDETGTLQCTFFNQPWRANSVSSGDVVTVFGKLRLYRGRRQMANPLVDRIGDQTGRIVPIYPQSAKAEISSLQIAKYVAEALERAGAFDDPLPEAARRPLRLVGRSEAFRSVHAPETFARKEAAVRRLAFDELLRLQILLVSRRRVAAESSQGIAHLGDGHLVGEYVSRLPFELTKAQQKAIEQMEADLRSPLPMNRLLQGDVGAGKTVVALAALLTGVESGHQGAFMVPTEVLAEQHFLAASRLLAGLHVSDNSRLGGERPLLVDLLTNRTAGSDRTRIMSELADGSLDIVVGTHALIAEGVGFRSLGVVVVDEQHRFGVEQRAALREKAKADPDLLVMTATPIPRTAAMTVYGDLDQSVLDELPAGRSPVATTWLVGESREEGAWRKVRHEVAAGRQAFVVCPFVGDGGAGDDEEAPEDPDAGLDDEDLGWQPRLPGVARPAEPARPARSASEEHARLRSGALAGLRLGLLHGQMPSREKEAVMGSFRAGEIDVLVATTVVEVGVDVANATVMVVEDADRFGIAQLHQLRGRVGRSSLESFCYLLTAEEVTETARRRLEALEATQDGFALAEEDLELRGGGTVLGGRQKGRTDLKLASLKRHRDLVTEARRVAKELIEADGELSGPHGAFREELEAFVSKEEAEYLFRS